MAAKNITYRSIKYNIPLHVFFNGGPVRWVPYMCRAYLETKVKGFNQMDSLSTESLSAVPSVIFELLECQCYYLPKYSKQMKIIESIFVKFPKKRKLGYLRQLCRTNKRVR